MLPPLGPVAGIAAVASAGTVALAAADLTAAADGLGLYQLGSVFSASDLAKSAASSRYLFSNARASGEVLTERMIVDTAESVKIF